MGCGNSKGVDAPTPKKVDGRTVVGKHLKTDADLVDWPMFPEDCTSLVSKHLTEDVWNKYKDE